MRACVKNYIINFGILSIIYGNTLLYSQDFTQAKNALQLYMKEWFINTNTNDNWFLEINGFKFPQEGVEFGLKTLDKNLKEGKISKAESEQIRQQYINTYIDQSIILANTYQDLLKNKDLDFLLQEFLHQAAMQIWLDQQMKKDPKDAIPSQDEINAYYKENTERLIQLGLSASQIKEYTEQELRHLKLKQWTLKQLQNIDKNTKITINPSLKKKLHIK